MFAWKRVDDGVAGEPAPSMPAISLEARIAPASRRHVFPLDNAQTEQTQAMREPH
jgi:hypothetical protein